MSSFHLLALSSLILSSLCLSSATSTATISNNSTQTSLNTTSHNISTLPHSPLHQIHFLKNQFTKNTSKKLPKNFRLLDTRYCNSQEECLSRNSICRMDTHECQCNLGYHNADDGDPATFNCTRINCSKNTQCLEDFTNVRCWNHICTCDENHRLDVITQTCRFEIDPTGGGGGESPLVTFLTIFAITLGVLLLLAISIIFCLVCQQRVRKDNGGDGGGSANNMIFVPTWAGGRGGDGGGGEGRSFPGFFNNFGAFLSSSSSSSANLNSASTTTNLDEQCSSPRQESYFENPNYQPTITNNSLSSSHASEEGRRGSRTPAATSSSSPAPRTPPPSYNSQESRMAPSFPTTTSTNRTTPVFETVDLHFEDSNNLQSSSASSRSPFRTNDGSQPNDRPIFRKLQIL